MKRVINCVVTALLVGVYGMVVVPSGVADTKVPTPAASPVATPMATPIASPVASPVASASSSPTAKPAVTPSAATSVSAGIAPSVAIIDTGLNDSLFTNVVGEYCVLKFGVCPNGQQIMDGKGAANIPATAINPTLAHGNEIASVISKVNPGIKLVPIRIVGMTGTNSPMIATMDEIKWALDWVVLNRTKYNIQAVNISQGKIFPGCTFPTGTQADIDALRAANVAVIVATGNNSNRTAVNSPACMPGVIAIGATDNPDPGVSGKAYDPNAKPRIALYSNGNTATDFYLNGRWYALQPDGKQKFTLGTSISTAAFTGWYTLNYKGSIDATYKYLVSTATTASNEWLSGRYLFVPSALLP